MNYRQPFSGDYPITQGFGETTTNPAGHTGIDYGCPAGTPVLASETGKVVYSGWKNCGYGYCVFISHKDGNTTIYEHLLAEKVVHTDQIVVRGQVIGYSGNTGNSTGAHLHFEVRDRDGKPFNPMALPMMSEDDSISAPVNDKLTLKEPETLGENVEIVAPSGAWGWSPNFSVRKTVFPCGTKLHFTGNTKERIGYTYCECYPEPVKYWVAVHDGDTQILDNVPTNESESSW